MCAYVSIRAPIKVDDNEGEVEIDSAGGDKDATPLSGVNVVSCDCRCVW